MRPILPVLAVLALTAATAEGADIRRAHDGGFFLRLSAGLGSANTSIDAGGEDLEFSGMSGDANFAVGGIVSRNLALHATMWGWTTADPDVEFGDVEGEIDGSIQLNAIGAGLTHYIMPSNVYLSGSIGAAWLEFDDDEFGEEDSDTGLALDATVGKEWWVGNRWGLGLAGALGYHSVPVDGTDENFSGVTFGVRFSATMN